MQAYWTFGISWFVAAGSVILISCYLANGKG